MVKIQDDYIQLIHADELINVKKDESLEISTHQNTYKIQDTYKINKSAIITIDNDSVKFIHWGNIIDLNYKDIEHIYLIKQKERDFIFLIPMSIIFILGIICGVFIGMG